jgi:hypothetical protein
MFENALTKQANPASSGINSLLTEAGLRGKAGVDRARAESLLKTSGAGISRTLASVEERHG